MLKPWEIKYGAALMGGADFATPDDLADFAKAERAIFALMSDGAWHTTEAITQASGGQGEALRRMRSLKNKISTCNGRVRHARYAHIECRRARDGQRFLYKLSWRMLPQRERSAGVRHA